MFNIKTRLLTLTILLPLATSCLTPIEKDEASVSSASSVQITSVSVYVNGVLQGPPPIHMEEGDTISMVANATDANSLSLEYKFQLFQHGTLAQILQGFSSSNIMPTYTVTAADINAGNFISVSVRNSDGIDDINLTSGDADKTISLNVTNQTSPPVAQSVDIYVNGVMQTYIPNNNSTPELIATLNVHVGDIISIVGHATDPNSLPLEYKFMMFRNGSLSGVIQDFGSSNTLASYAVTSADINAANFMVLCIRNNDGIDYLTAVEGDVDKVIYINASP